MNNGIQPSGYVYEKPLHKMKLFSEHNSVSLSVTEDYCASHFCLPIYPSMDKRLVEKVCKTLDLFFIEHTHG